MRLPGLIIAATSAALTLPCPLLGQCDQPLSASSTAQNTYEPCREGETSGLEARVDYDEPTGAFIVSVRYPPDSPRVDRPSLRGVSLMPELPEDACTGPLSEARHSTVGLTTSWTSMACRAENGEEALLVLFDTDAGTFHRSIEAHPGPPTGGAPVLDALPRGVILVWYSRESLPPGFILCDGTNGTPDLVGRFPMGTRDPIEIGSKTGSATHDHSVGHLRATAPRSGNGGSPDGWHAQGMNQLGTPQTTGLNHTHGIEGLVDPASNIPPSTRVMFICKR